MRRRMGSTCGSTSRVGPRGRCGCWRRARSRPGPRSAAHRRRRSSRRAANRCCPVEPRLAWEPPADDELLALHHSSACATRRRASRARSAVEPLHDDAFEPEATPRCRRAAWPLPTDAGGVCHVRPGELESFEQRAPVGVRQVHRRMAVEPQQVEHMYTTGIRSASLRTWSLAVDLHAPLQQLEARAGRRRRARRSRRRARLRVLPSASPRPAQLRDSAGVTSLPVAASRAGCGRRRRTPIARMPSHFISHDQPSSSSGASVLSVASIGRRSSGGGSRVGILGRIHAVDHPLLARRCWNST